MQSMVLRVIGGSSKGRVDGGRVPQRTLRQMENDGLCESKWDTTNGGGPARRVYSITDTGEAYLEFWAKALEQYQRNVDTFFRLYIGKPPRTAQHKDDG